MRLPCYLASNQNQSLEEEIKQAKKQAEEEKLRQEENWEELTNRKLADQEAKYLAQIETLNNNLSTTQKQLQEVTTARANLDNLVNEYTRRQAAFDQYILNGGKREYFENVWKGELRDRTSLEDGKIKIAKEDGSNEIERDEAGEPLSMGDWMIKYRANGGGIFFNPINNAAGSGIPPTNTENTTNQTQSKVLYITRKEAGSQKFMNELKNKLDGKDPLRAISEGQVIVRN
ncbi:MAG: hypothetical protein QNJ70_30405 [Xenococcaceae cyanobacterium MO_207.B15]|nr:hypothetical protein [Xenococcaceae cyanobacterium MO_207.B15]